ncbi:SRPBCC domain-containing protein [Fulvivirga ligni]|uniref:SRPBCC domain-containing protein n=1 Tax=Fulvivirga ligni TaxID=2904246 RepID=UPI001F21D3C8|nr:SRPBCC domain-containing protein [Fulvivirga ligni]UII19120.1 SRPBCC domain-containing protein [Fulvivirga ligni]
MKTLEFKKDIKASAEKTYDTMLGLKNIKTYEQWAAEFNPTSTYEGSWDKGSKIYFIGTDDEGNKGGMVSEIADNVPFSFVSIRHYGILNGETEITKGEEVEKWTGGMEKYRFNEHDGVTTVHIEVDVAEDFADDFKATWPKALNKLQELAENQN